MTLILANIIKRHVNSIFKHWQNIEQHFNLSDAEFEQQFENCTLNPELFTQEAHLRLAWVRVTKYGIVMGNQKPAKQLRQFADYVGK